METIKLDLIPGKKMPSLHASQYDDGREHGIDLFENGVVYKLDGTETLTINERKGDDCICSLDIENTFAGSNHIVFASTEQMCAVWGNNICELVIAKGEKTIGTLNFILEIEPSPTEGGIESESEIKNLERQIEEITEQVIGDDYYTADQTDEAIATATEGKADTTYVDTELAKKADKNNTYTKTEVDEKIDELPEPMIFKGTLGVGGTIQILPTASASNEGWTFKCITAGTYAGLTLKVGDTVTCFNPPNTSNYYWDKTGSQDTDTDTWRAIKVNGVEKLGNGISSGAVDFEDTANVKFEFDANGNKIKATLDGIYTDSEVDDFLDDKADADNTYTKAQVDDIVYGILPDDTASGSVANFDTSLELPLKSLEIDVNAKQDLHGYDYPWTAGGGKNKLQVMPFETKTSNGITFTYNNDGTVTLDGTSTGRAYQYLRTYTDGWLKNNNTYTVSMRGLPNTALSTFLNCAYSDNGTTYSGTYGSVTGNSERTITPTHEYNSVLLDIPSGQTFNKNKIYVQIEEGSVATDWTPYENICPISGWSEISLVSCGKNLFDEDTWFLANGYTKNDDGSYYKATNPLNVKLWENKTGYSGQISLSFQYKYDNATQIGFYPIVRYTDETQSIAYTSPTTTFATRTLTSTSGKIVKEIISSYGNNIGSTIKDFQIEVGSNVSAFEPYNGTTEVINLGGTYYGGHFTQDKDGHRQFEVTSKFATFTGANTESWNDYPTGNGYFINQINDHIKESYGNGKCNILPIAKTFSTLGVVFGINSNYIFLMQVKNSWNISTVNELRNFLSVNNLQVVYTLAEPIIIDLPDGEPIITINGTNNIYADTGDTEVVFKCSVNDYVSAHSGGNLLGMGGVYLGGAKSSGGEEDPTEDTEKVKLDETKVEVKEIGDDSNIKKLGGE